MRTIESVRRDTERYLDWKAKRLTHEVVSSLTQYTNRCLLGDCLELMKTIPDKSIDMILTDMPYGTTSCHWDTEIELDTLWSELKRLIKSSSNIVFTASQPFTGRLLMSNPDWFSHGWIWEKEQGVNFLLANKMPLKIHEDILVFRKPDTYGITEFVELRNLFRDIFNKIGKSKKQIIDELGQGLDHCFRCDSSQWGLPTKTSYERLISFYNLVDLPNYDYLLGLYQSEFYRIYNPQITNGSPYISGKGTSGEVTNHVEKIQTVNNGTRLPTTILRFNRETGLHPTQKPVPLLEYLIKTYTNEGDLILDCFAGSGSTAIACLNTNRKYICVEKEQRYFDIMNNRIQQHSNLEVFCN